MPYGYDEKMGVDRYQLMSDFFDRYLKVDDRLAPVVLIVSPRDNMQDVPRSGQIIVDFAPVIDQGSVIRDKGIKILLVKSKKEVEGTWKVSHKGTRYTFKPLQDFTANERYTIEITTAVKDLRGIHLEKAKECEFHCSSRIVIDEVFHGSFIFKTINMKPVKITLFRFILFCVAFFCLRIKH